MSSDSVPSIDFDFVQLLRTYYQLEVKEIKRLPGEVDINAFLKTVDNQEYILKIARPQEDRENLELQNEAISYLAAQQLPLRLPKVVNNHLGQSITTILDANGAERFLRLLSWVPGRLWAKVNPHSSALLESLGRASGITCRGLQGLRSPRCPSFLQMG